jgi:hypothetical protein
MSSKSLIIFEKASDFKIKPPLSKKKIKKPRYFYKSLIISLKMSSKLFQMPTLLEKVSISL